mgnify:CR=1 FL=1
MAKVTVRSEIPKSKPALLYETLRSAGVPGIEIRGDDDSVGLIKYNDPQASRRLLLGRWPMYMGTIFFRDWPGLKTGANNNHWVFEVYGRHYLEEAAQIAQLFASEHAVDIDVRLVQEVPEADKPLHQTMD